MFYKRVQNDLSEVFSKEEFLEKSNICILGIRNLDFSMMSAKELYDLYTFALINMEYNKQGYLAECLKAFPEYRQTGSFAELAGYDKREGFKMYNFAVHYIETVCENKKEMKDMVEIMKETRSIYKNKKWNGGEEQKLKILLNKVKNMDNLSEEEKE